MYAVRCNRSRALFSSFLCYDGKSRQTIIFRLLKIDHSKLYENYAKNYISSIPSPPPPPIRLRYFANEFQSPLPQARERLLSKVKADQERLKQLDAGLTETREDTERLKQRLEDLESDMKRDKKGEEVSQNKVFLVYFLFLMRNKGHYFAILVTSRVYFLIFL